MLYSYYIFDNKEIFFSVHFQKNETGPCDLL